MAKGYNEKIKVGVLLSSYKIPVWYKKLLDEIDKSDFAEITLLIKDNSKLQRGKDKYFFQNFFSKDFPYTLYSYIDKRLFKVSHDFRKIVNCEAQLKNKKTLLVNPILKKYYVTFPDETIEEIKATGVDVLLRIGFGIMKGEILNVAPLGIWSYHHGDVKNYRGKPSSFWELYNNEKVVSGLLQILSSELDSGIILSQGYSAVNNISLNRTMQRLYWRSFSFFLDNLKYAHALGEEKFLEKSRENHFKWFIDDKVNKMPSPFIVVALVFKVIYRYIASHLKAKLFPRRWYILYSEGDGRNISRYKKLLPPKGLQWADPFVINYKEKTYIFFESLDKNYIGSIFVTSLENIEQNIAPVKVLERDYHLSYPFVFEYEGEHYMMPETKKNGTIELFRATNFPYEWELHKILMNNVEAVDSSLFKYNGKWWLFTNMARSKGASASEELHIFYSDNPLSHNWQPHLMNPIISDIRHSRNAGGILLLNGNYYRPSQDCATSYGYSISLNKIEKLSETEYKESIVSSILPNWNKKVNGIHTINQAGKVVVMDARGKI